MGYSAGTRRRTAVAALNSPVAPELAAVRRILACGSGRCAGMPIRRARLGHCPRRGLGISSLEAREDHRIQASARGQCTPRPAFGFAIGPSLDEPAALPDAEGGGVWMGEGVGNAKALPRPALDERAALLEHALRPAGR